MTHRQGGGCGKADIAVLFQGVAREGNHLFTVMKEDLKEHQKWITRFLADPQKLDSEARMEERAATEDDDDTSQGIHMIFGVIEIGCTKACIDNSLKRMNLELRLRILQHGAIASKARVMASIFDMVSRYRPLWLQDHLPSRRDSESIRFNPEKHEKEVQLNLADLKSTSKGLDYFIPVSQRRFAHTLEVVDPAIKVAIDNFMAAEKEKKAKREKAIAAKAKEEAKLKRLKRAGEKELFKADGKVTSKERAGKPTPTKAALKSFDLGPGVRRGRTSQKERLSTTQGMQGKKNNSEETDAALLADREKEDGDDEDAQEEQVPYTWSVSKDAPVEEQLLGIVMQLRHYNQGTSKMMNTVAQLGTKITMLEEQVQALKEETATDKDQLFRLMNAIDGFEQSATVRRFASKCWLDSILPFKRREDLLAFLSNPLYMEAYAERFLGTSSQLFCGNFYNDLLDIEVFGNLRVYSIHTSKETDEMAQAVPMRLVQLMEKTYEGTRSTAKNTDHTKAHPGFKTKLDSLMTYNRKKRSKLLRAKQEAGGPPSQAASKRKRSSQPKETTTEVKADDNEEEEEELEGEEDSSSEDDNDKPPPAKKGKVGGTSRTAATLLRLANASKSRKAEKELKDKTVEAEKFEKPNSPGKKDEVSEESSGSSDLQKNEVEKEETEVENKETEVENEETEVENEETEVENEETEVENEESELESEETELENKVHQEPGPDQVKVEPVSAEQDPLACIEAEGAEGAEGAKVAEVATRDPGEHSQA